MEESPNNKQIEVAQEEKSLEDLGLPNEIWAIILEFIYFNPSILDEAKDIYEAIDIIEKHFKNCYSTIPLVCKTSGIVE